MKPTPFKPPPFTVRWKNYLNVQLSGVVEEHLGGVFEKIKEFIWKIFDPVVKLE